MNPVNLLPAKHRPRTGGGDGDRTSYIALGVLAGLVLAVLMFVMSANQVSSTQAEIEQVQKRLQAAQTQAVTLQSFGDFAGVKASRIEAVKSLATTRLDWERLFRELAHVLPERVWLTGFDGTSTGAGGDPREPDQVTGPTVKLEGCAATHSRVADVMVRLRGLHGAQEVQLTESAKADTGAAAGGALVPGAAAGTTTSPSSGCGPYTSFKMEVTLSAAEPEAPAGEAPASEVPARLGGGA